MYDAENNSLHKSVMLREMLDYLDPQKDKIYVDCTFGAGGYSKAILEKTDCYVYAIDCDPEVESIANKLGEKYTKFHFNIGRYSEIKEIIAKYNIVKIDGIILDLGVSSMQLDERKRGFSFMGEGPLDMRMTKSGIDAAYIINNYSEKELADIIYYFGEDKDSRKIAKKICTQRLEKEINSTEEFANLIRSVKPKKYSKIDHATKTFQALRIYVNNELEELKSMMSMVLDLLNIGGKLITVSFHSLEDKIVKDFIKSNYKVYSGSRYSPYEPQKKEIQPKFKLLTKKALLPTEEEVNFNPRSRSARLRAVEKIGN